MEEECLCCERLVEVDEPLSSFEAALCQECATDVFRNLTAEDDLEHLWVDIGGEG